MTQDWHGGRPPDLPGVPGRAGVLATQPAGGPGGWDSPALPAAHSLSGPRWPPLTLRPAFRGRWDLADIDDEPVPVGAVDGNSEADRLLVLVEGDTANLDQLDMPIGRKVEVVRLDLIGGSPLYGVLVSALLDAEFREIGPSSKLPVSSSRVARTSRLLG